MGGKESASAERLEMGTALTLATKAGQRTLGLLLVGPNDKALLLVPCSDVHTVGMRQAIDVAFIDQRGVVIESHRSVGPFRRLRNGRAVAVVERFSLCGEPWFCAGDQVVLSGREEVAP